VTVGLFPPPVRDALSIEVDGTAPCVVASAAPDRVGRGRNGRARTRKAAGAPTREVAGARAREARVATS
jgi:hypothetical protein